MIPRASVLATALTAIVLAVGCDLGSTPPPSTAEKKASETSEAVERSEEAPEYATSSACRSCHEKEFRAWTGSHHDRAMQKATGDTVLGDFSGEALSIGGAFWEFFRDGDRYMVRTEGADGETAAFEVLHTFGVEPLQQYLVSFPDGRLQALTVAWDARPREAGGQRWFSVTPGEPAPAGDVLHWTGAANRWNFMCADCHSTGLRKNFDLESKHYDTTWSEIDVACEACHGPGSQHVRWAQAGVPGEPSMGLTQRLGSRADASWVMDPERGIARRLPKRTEHRELEVCAPCHARRSRIHPAEVGEPFLDNHRLALLEDPLYFPDGQIRDEVYVYGSFVQSKMYREGVTCSDCHDPHSSELRHSGDALCGQCHATDRYAVPSHHHHPLESAGARCVSCHMPSRTYMAIDDRRDHSFRVPRPDLSIELGTPNPCSSCHAQEGDAWAVAKLADWGVAPSRETRQLSVALASARTGGIDAPRELRDLARLAAVPGIARATAVAALARYPGERSAEVIAEAAGDADPLLRFAAAHAAEGLPPAERVPRISALLNDDLRSVRIEAARVLASVPVGNLPARLRGPQRKALAEYRSAQRMNGDDPSAHVNLALIDLALGRLDRAEIAYLRAIDVGSYFVPAHVNLADLYRHQGRDPEAEQVLRQVALRAPESAEVQHSLGLVLVRLQRNDEALTALRRAAEGAPDSPRFGYVYAIALHSFGEARRAVEVLEACHQRHPGEASVLQALSSMHRELDNPEAARRYAEKLEALLARRAE